MYNFVPQHIFFNFFIDNINTRLIKIESPWPFHMFVPLWRHEMFLGYFLFAGSQYLTCPLDVHLVVLLHTYNLSSTPLKHLFLFFTFSLFCILPKLFNILRTVMASEGLAGWAGERARRAAFEGPAPETIAPHRGPRFTLCPKLQVDHRRLPHLARLLKQKS